MRVVIGLLVVLACACGAGPQRKVAVVGVEKPNGLNDKTFEAWLAERVDRQFDVVTKATYLKEAEELGAEEMTEQNVRRVAKRLGAAAVVYGSLTGKKAGKMLLTVRVHDGSTGALIETHEIEIKKGKVNTKNERRFAKELLALLPPPADEERPTRRSKKREAPVEASPEDDNAPEADESDEETPATVVATRDPVVKPELKPEKKKTEKAEKKTETRVEKKSEPKPEPKPAKTKPRFEAAEDAPATKFRGGQALDEEMPEMLEKK